MLPAEESAYNQFYRAWSRVVKGERGRPSSCSSASATPIPWTSSPGSTAALLAVLTDEAALGGDVVRELARQRLEHRAVDGELTLKQAQVLASRG